ncbi:HD-GYP domain-containing protein [Massilia sp. PAMC28688]|nr:HD-GYP domain-containing protein [Massilia sp. PAMC28688]
MFLVRFEGAWLSNPFWTSRFLLDNPADLAAARASGVKECWIDVSLGRDVAGPAPVLPAVRGTPHLVTNRQKTRQSLHAPLSMDDELRNAAKLCGTARHAIVAMFSQARLGKVVDLDVCAGLVDDIVGSVERHPGALISLARLKSDDDYTYMHSVAVCALMVALAKAMKLTEADVREAGLSGLLHDIGKAKIPLDILNKPGALDDEEFATVKRHPEHAYAALLHGGVSEQVRQACLHHHERMDGNGYPAGQSGQEIALLARMSAVCDVYDAVTSDRPYKRGWDPADALAKMISWKGHFDPKVLASFIEVVGIYPTGSLVRLKSARLAVVVEQNKHSYTRPVVRTFYCTASARALPPELLNLADAEDDCVSGPEERQGWPTALIEKLWAGKLAP